MKVTLVLVLHFLFLKRNYFIFNLHNFLVDADQNTTFPLLTLLTQFSYTETGNFPDDFIFFSEICNFNTPRQATFITIFDQVTSFSHIDRQACGQFYDLNETRNFYRVDILHFLGTL